MSLLQFAIVFLSLGLACGVSLAADAAALAQPEVYLWPQLTDETTNVRQEGKAERYEAIGAPSIRVFLPEQKTEQPVAAVLVCPGGGYSHLAYEHEGLEFAHWFTERGMAAFVLRYRIPKQRENALADAQRAMGLIRQRAKEWNINPDKVGAIGFSAGGHLVASLSNFHDKRQYEPVDEADSLPCRPDGAMLIYPAYLAKADGGVTVPVTETTPPTFLIQTEDDPINVDCSLFYAHALKVAKVPVTLHVFPVGGHGYGFRSIKGKPVELFPMLLQAWLENTGFLPKPDGKPAEKLAQ